MQLKKNKQKKKTYNFHTHEHTEAMGPPFRWAKAKKQATCQKILITVLPTKFLMHLIWMAVCVEHG